MKMIKFLFLSFLILAITPIVAQTKVYKIDDKHTSVLWKVDHFGFSEPSGKWFAEGTIQYDDTAPQNSNANIKIDLARLITGISELDQHLKGKAFFDVQTYPEANYVTDKVMITDGKITQVDGKLTLHGVTRPVSLKIKQNKMGINPITEKQTIGFSGEAQLNRSDFGISTLIPGVSDKIKLTIEVEAFQE